MMSGQKTDVSALDTSTETNSNFYCSTSCELNDRMFNYFISMYFYAKTFVSVQIYNAVEHLSLPSLLK